jgi:hypothetical protein
MKKIFAFILGFCVLSCTPKVIEKIDKGNIMVNVMKGKYSYAQFDSMCIADTLPRNLTDWKFLGLVEYETKDKHSLFLYMKSNGRNEVVYKVEELMSDSVKITKRIIKD